MALFRLSLLFLPCLALSVQRAHIESDARDPGSASSLQLDETNAEGHSDDGRKETNIENGALLEHHGELFADEIQDSEGTSAGQLGKKTDRKGQWGNARAKAQASKQAITNTNNEAGTEPKNKPWDWEAWGKATNYNATKAAEADKRLQWWIYNQNRQQKPKWVRFGEGGRIVKGAKLLQLFDDEIKAADEKKGFEVAPAGQLLENSRWEREDRKARNGVEKLMGENKFQGGRSAAEVPHVSLDTPSAEMERAAGGAALPRSGSPRGGGLMRREGQPIAPERPTA